jgi:hypothetical protein
MPLEGVLIASSDPLYYKKFTNFEQRLLELKGSEKRC